MLFKSQRSQLRYANGTGYSNQFYHQNNVPDWLDLLCKQPGHPLPCRMRFIGIGTSPKGQPFAAYACPLCNTREGWVYNRFTNQPYRLWLKPAGQ